MEPKKYLLFVTLPYAYSILRPLEHEIRRRGGAAAWFVEAGCPVALEEGEVRSGDDPRGRRLQSRSRFSRRATTSPISIPGVKVALFHGYAIQKAHRGRRRPLHRARLVRHLLHAGAEQYALFQGAGAAIRLLPGLRDRLAQSRHLFLARSAASGRRNDRPGDSLSADLHAQCLFGAPSDGGDRAVWPKPSRGTGSSPSIPS